ncbi:MAG TPA: hypothetical protein VHY08_09265, partial [Bacillota bacterium]|nr:hypothetical protein [Bacillota bacterium]
MSEHRNNDYHKYQSTPGGGPGAGRPGGPGRPGGFFGGGHGPVGMPGEKPKNFKGALKRLLVYLKPYSVKMSVVLLFAI